MTQRRYSGQWSSKYIGNSLQPYATAAVWGTGINPIHEMYGEAPPLRVMGREGEEGSAGYDSQPAGTAVVPGDLISSEMWGYTTEDSLSNNYVYYDDRPSWNEQPSEYRGDADNHPAWGEWAEPFRSQEEGAHRYRQKMADSLPSETVTEGWRNKPKGNAANAVPSDPSQYEIQTSMRQRYETRNNQHAVDRGTDDARSVIHSRVVGQKLKIYSGEQRHYDMFPFQQDTILRPFWFRKAGTGQPALMLPNEMTVATPFQRIPPPDPSIGINETDSGDYGYTQEDTGYFYG